MTSPDYDRPVPLGELAKSLRQRNRPNKSPDVKILFRWALKGLSGVRLQTVRVEGRVCSTVRWLAEFLRKTGADRVHRMRQAVYENARRPLEQQTSLTARTTGRLAQLPPFPRGWSSSGHLLRGEGLPAPARLEAGSR